MNLAEKKRVLETVQRLLWVLGDINKEINKAQKRLSEKQHNKKWTNTYLANYHMLLGYIDGLKFARDCVRKAIKTNRHKQTIYTKTSKEVRHK